MLTIPGNYLEGGGSIVRLSTALSAITGKEIKINDIRAKRDKPGLKTQHLRAIESVSKLCSGNLTGNKIGSTEIEFAPGKIEKHSLNVNIETAGSVSLLLQCLMLPCFFAKNEVEINITGGGTSGLNAPTLLYTKYVLLPLIKKFGFNAELEIKKEGFYPKGGSIVTFKTKPVKKIFPVILKERGKLIKDSIYAIASDDLGKNNVLERAIKETKKIIPECENEKEYVKTFSTGMAYLVLSEFENTIIGQDAIGSKGKRAEDIGKETALKLNSLLKTNATVDEFMTDQILIFMGLSGEGEIIFPSLSLHAKTNIWLIEKFLDVKFKIDGNRVTCRKA